jgi:hypothetical protein
MPHYEDGTEAQLGDVIHGKPYNTPHEVIGVVVGITPAQEACNLRVAFARAAKPGEELHGVDAFGDGAPAPLVAVKLDKDYGETKAFRLVHRGR